MSNEPILKTTWHITAENTLTLELSKRLSSTDRKRLAKLFEWVLNFATDEDGENILTCVSCGKPYHDFPLDVIIPDEQWKLISPTGDEGGILCAACIVKFGAEGIPGVTVAKMVFE